MVKIVKEIVAELPDVQESISEEGFRQALRWGLQHRSPLTNLVVNPFKESVIGQTGYKDSNRPDEEVKTLVEVGDKAKFNVATKPTTKRPAYAGIVTALGSFVDVTVEMRGQGKVRGVRRIGDEHFISVPLLVGKLEEYVTAIREGREGALPEKEPSQKTITEKSARIFYFDKFFRQFQDNHQRIQPRCTHSNTF